MVCGIYKITSPSDKVYIGQSTNLLKRFNQYKTNHHKKQIRLYNSFQKYGWDSHIFEVIEECEPSLLNEKERYYQELFDCTGIKGLNCTLVSTNIKKAVNSVDSNEKNRQIHKRLYAEGKSKLSELNKTQIGENNPFYGKTHTEESRNKISKANLGRKWNEEQRLNKKLNYTRENHPSYGRKHNKETKEKISKKAKERLAIWHPNALAVINIDTLEVFKDVTTANLSVFEIKKSRRELCRILNLETYNPSRLMYLSKYNDYEEKEKALKRMEKPVPKYASKDTITGKVYDSIFKASEATGIEKEQLRRMLHGIKPNTTNLVFINKDTVLEGPQQRKQYETKGRRLEKNGSSDKESETISPTV